MIVNPGHRLILASGSQTRHRLLETVGLVCEIVRPKVDEREIEAGMPDAVPVDLALALARAKALSIKVNGAWIIAADQILSQAGRFFHKASTREEGLATLSALAGRTHRLTSAFVIAKDGQVVVEGWDEAHLTMRDLSPSALSLYLDRASPALESVGVYQIEGLGLHLFEAVEGDYTTILGMPMLKLLAALRRLGALAL